MSGSRRELLAAAYKYRARTEDCLTELVATTLGVHAGFARLLFERAGIELPAEDVRFEAFTQRSVAPGCRPDMLVNAHVGAKLVAQLWSEHKTASGFRELQLEDYLAALRDRPHVGALIAIVAEPDEEREDREWELLTWQDVAELANAAGRAWRHERWREAALDPTAPARERLLHELLWYLEEEGFAVVDALDASNLEALRNAADTFARIEALLERTTVKIERASAFEFAGADHYDDGYQYWVLFRVPEGSWARQVQTAGWRADLELMVAGSDDWWPDGTGEPAFGAGLTLAEPLYEALAADEDWVDGLDTDGITIAPFQENTRVYRTLPVRELLTAGGTLDEQARTLAEWATESFRLVGDRKPSEAVEPPARRRRRRGGANEEHDDRLTQPVTAADIAGGRVRIPRGSAKGLFPPTAGEVTVTLRGRTLTCRWNPRFGRSGGQGERSGRLHVSREVLAKMVEPNEQLRISANDAGALCLD